MQEVNFISVAEREMLEAAEYYEDQSDGLGIAFLCEVHRASRDIARNPRRWPVVRDQTRRRMLRRFPYAILYRINPDEIVGIAVMHLHRRPDYWLDRI